MMWSYGTPVADPVRRTEERGNVREAVAKRHGVRKQDHSREQERMANDEAGMFRLGWSLAMVAAAGLCWTEVMPAACRR